MREEQSDQLFLTEDNINEILKTNCHGIGLDDPIFRIFQLKFIQKDIKDDCVTYVLLRPETWGDPFENPLINQTFTDDVTGEHLSLAGIVNDFYALSWTKKEKECADDWSSFSHGKPAVRIGTTPRLLLKPLIKSDDRNASLRNHIGLVQYLTEDELNSQNCDPDWPSHINPNFEGQGYPRSLMRLRSGPIEKEEEVRLLFSLMESNSQDWLSKNVRLDKKDNVALCKIPFDWKGVIQSVLFQSSVSHEDEISFLKILESKGMNCQHSRSLL